ncbi:hypothetical protein, partial [uncultured Eubacterium sp.]|uniref:hypothetical protein n=1 Tax=uncultured Eubacterium sp. TaxID=165185 RepID=UPI002591EBD9
YLKHNGLGTFILLRRDPPAHPGGEPQCQQKKTPEERLSSLPYIDLLSEQNCPVFCPLLNS